MSRLRAGKSERARRATRVPRRESSRLGGRAHSHTQGAGPKLVAIQFELSNVSCANLRNRAPFQVSPSYRRWSGLLVTREFACLVLRGASSSSSSSALQFFQPMHWRVARRPGRLRKLKKESLEFGSRRARKESLELATCERKPILPRSFSRFHCFDRPPARSLAPLELVGVCAGSRAARQARARRPDLSLSGGPSACLAGSDWIARPGAR